MLRTVTPLVLAGMLVASPLAGPQAPDRPAGAGARVGGRVIDAGTQHGIAGVLVRVLSVPNPASGPNVLFPRAQGRTDSQGRFAFTGLPWGTYQIDAEAPVGHTSVSGGHTRLVDLADEAAVFNITLRLWKLGSILGTVQDDAGDPVSGVEVFAFRRGGVTRPAALTTGSGTSRTDDRGRYRITGLAPGEYYICACRRPLIPFDDHLLTTLASRPVELLGIAERAARVGAEAASLDRTLRTFPPTFHPDTTLAARAVPVRVAGDDRSSIDITATAVASSRVAGMIVGVPPTGLPAAAVRLVPGTDPGTAMPAFELAPMLVQPDGRFDFAQVPPGQYTLEVRTSVLMRSGGPSGAALAFIGGRSDPAPAMPLPGSQVSPLWASHPITVGTEDVIGLTVSLQGLVPVAGRMEFRSSATAPSSRPTRGSVSLGSLDSGGLGGSGAPFGSDGAFRFAVVPGRYMLAIPNLPGWPTRTSVTAAGIDISDMVLNVGAQGISDLVITMTDVPMAELRGTVSVGAEGADVNTWVFLFPTDTRYWEDNFVASRRFLSARVDMDAFAIRRVPAGDYYVVAVSERSSDWMEKSQLEALSAIASHVRIIDGQDKVLDLKRQRQD